MKLKVSFTVDVSVEGDQPSRDDLAEWVEAVLQDVESNFGDDLSEYWSDEYELEHVSAEFVDINVR